jgi:mannose-6-phosphate isomerase-like protein (cupin superfamily)
MFKKHVTLKLVFATLMFVFLFWHSAVMAIPLSDRQQVTIFHPSEEKGFVVGKDQFKFKHFTGSSGRDAETLGTAEITLAPNYDGFLLQKHVVNVDEMLYVMQGSVECVSSQSKSAIQVKAGDIVQIPAGVPYGCKGTGSKPSRLLVVSPSSALESLIAEIGTPASKSLQATSEPDMAKVAAVAQKYGIEFLN